MYTGYTTRFCSTQCHVSCCGMRLHLQFPPYATFFCFVMSCLVLSPFVLCCTCACTCESHTAVPCLVLHTQIHISWVPMAHHDILFALAHVSHYQRYTFRLKQPEILLIGFKNVEYAQLIPSGSTWQYLADYVTILMCSHKAKYSVQANGAYTAWRAGPGGLSPSCVGRPTPMACLYLHRHAPHHGNIIRIVGYYLSEPLCTVHTHVMRHCC